MKQFFIFLLSNVGILGIFSFYIQKRIESNMNRHLQEYKTELEKSSSKNITLWQDQKKLTFEFIEFMDGKIFFNPNIGNRNEQKKVFNEMNTFYGKLYLILDTEIIEKINEVITGCTSNVQRYYLYREIRKQLQKYLNDHLDKEEKYPYISIKIEKAPLLFNKKGEVKSFEDLQKIYPFIEKGDEKDTYKSLPVFEIVDKEKN